MAPEDLFRGHFLGKESINWKLWKEKNASGVLYQGKQTSSLGSMIREINMIRIWEYMYM